MKSLIKIYILLMTSTAFAQQFPQFDPQQMQGMMQKAGEMQACMQRIDQNELKAMETKGRKLHAELKSLCAAGQRSAAMNKAMTFSREMASNSTLQEMKKCGEMMQGFMPQISESLHSYDNQNGHVCDNL